MKLSATKAAKLAGVTTPTITRAIENGEITAEKKPKGGYLIDPSEIDRFKANRKTISNDTSDILQNNTPSENSVLQVKLDAKDELIERYKYEIEQLKSERDKWHEQAQKVTALIEGRTERKGFWARIFGT